MMIGCLAIDMNMIFPAQRRRYNLPTLRSMRPLPRVFVHLPYVSHWCSFGMTDIWPKRKDAMAGGLGGSLADVDLLLTTYKQARRGNASATPLRMKPGDGASFGKR